MHSATALMLMTRDRVPDGTQGNGNNKEGKWLRGVERGYVWIGQLYILSGIF